jgi:hypothetical protein
MNPKLLAGKDLSNFTIANIFIEKATGLDYAGYSLTPIISTSDPLFKLSVKRAKLIPDHKPAKICRLSFFSKMQVIVMFITTDANNKYLKNYSRLHFSLNSYKLTSC